VRHRTSFEWLKAIKQTSCDSAGRTTMRNAIHTTLAVAFAAGAVIGMLGDRVFAQAADPNAAPALYNAAETWAKLPEGRKWGSAIGIAVDKNDGGVWVLDRCAGDDCSDSAVPPIQKFDASGNYVRGFGARLFNRPHGLFVDDEGNVWVTDELAKNGKGAVAVKFSPEGRVLLTLGKPGAPGHSPDTLHGPSSVAVAHSGDIYIADGHGGDTNDRIVKFSKDGTFITAWGKHGKAAGEFDTLHGIALDSTGRVFAADRGNNRIQIFDPDGRLISEWKQFGRPNSITIDQNDQIYVADSQSNPTNNPGFREGIRIGNTKDGKVMAFISAGSSDIGAPDAVAADSRGNVYGGFVPKANVRRFTIRIATTNYAQLQALGGEAAGYGLYSYAILPVNSGRASAFLSEIFKSTLPIEGTYAKPNQLNILYIPLQKDKRIDFSTAAQVSGNDTKKLGDSYSNSFYDYQIATAILYHVCSAPPANMIRLCLEDLSKGPFIFTYAAPASKLEDVPPPYLFVDLSDVHERAFGEFLTAFREQVKREDVSDRKRIDTLRLRALSIILTAADWLPGMQKAIAEVIHYKN
jgi:sugar lactone lactonase YvrE